MIDWDDYQRRARETAIYPGMGNNLWYPALGLAGESGEVAEKIKKFYRDAQPFNLEFQLSIRRELGDVLWYIANLATEMDIRLSEVALDNLAKLADRRERGKLRGSGDNR